jgi:hypothetical protein
MIEPLSAQDVMSENICDQNANSIFRMEHTDNELIASERRKGGRATTESRLRTRSGK